MRLSLPHSSTVGRHSECQAACTKAVEKMTKSARKKKAEKTIRFDEKSRFVYLTGFRKRKQERRKKAVAEALEKERLENIQVKKEFREEVKKNWRDMQRANALNLKALGGGTKTLAITDAERLAAIEDGTAEQESDAGGVSAAATTVAFEREEDDPFGDCEVTTTVGDLCPAAGASQDPAARLWLAVSAASSTGSQADIDASADPVELYHRRRRRAETRKREEDRQKAALDRRVARKMKKNKGGGSKKKTRDKVAVKTTAKARRRRAKKACWR